MKTTRLFFLIVIGVVLNACASAPGLQVSVPQDLQVAARTGQTQHTSLSLSNPGDAPLDYRLRTNSSWLGLGAAAGTLAPRASVQVPLSLSCPAARATLQTSLTVTAGTGAAQAVAVTLHCQAPQLGVTDTTLQALVRQEQPGALQVSNSGDAPLAYTLSETADWLTLGGAATGRLEPGTSATVAFSARCPEVAGKLGTVLKVTSDDPDRPHATTPIDLVCADALAPGEEGFVAALGTWNWAEGDEAALGSSFLLGFRYLQPTTVTVTLTGPPGWNGDAPRQLTLPGPTFEDGAGADGTPDQTLREDVWTYDLLTDSAPPPQGVYHLAATTSRGDSYALDLTLDSSRFVPTPKNITVTPVGDGVSVSWAPVAGAKAYYAVVTDPTAAVVPRRVANPAVPSLNALAATVYARDFTAATRVELPASLVAGKRYQVTVVAFNSDLVLSDSESATLGVEVAASFDTSSASEPFTYAP